jgi:hypothetical protein
MPFYVVFNCGCRISKNRCIKKKVKNKVIPMCPNHNETEIRRIYFRCSCEKLDKFTPTGKPLTPEFNIYMSTRKWCNNCLKKRTREKQKKYDKEVRSKKAQEIQKIKKPNKKEHKRSKPDCKFYLQCLNDVCKDFKCKCVPCNNCNKYIKESNLDAADFIACNDNFMYPTIDF